MTINVKTKCNLYVAWYEDILNLREMSNLGFERLLGQIDVDSSNRHWNLDNIVRKEVQQGNTITLKSNYAYGFIAIFVK